MDQRVVTNGKPEANPRRGPNRQIFVGGYLPPKLAERFKALAVATFGSDKAVNRMLVLAIEEALARRGVAAGEQLHGKVDTDA